jgi:hypothetical protein
MTDVVVGTAKAAKWLGLSERAVRDMCAKGRLGGAYQPSGYSGKYLIPIATLERICPCPEWLRAELAEAA